MEGYRDQVFEFLSEIQHFVTHNSIAVPELSSTVETHKMSVRVMI